MGMKKESRSVPGYFTADEWKNLVELPYAVSMTVMVAAPNLMGSWGETKAVLQGPSQLATASKSALVGLIIAEAQPKARDLINQQQYLWKQDQAGYRTKTLNICKSAAVALAKVSPEEALAYKKWVLAIGLKVAEASREHGVSVSDREKTALSEISTALGISDTVLS
jgi:hypothetical protein